MKVLKEYTRARILREGDGEMYISNWCHNDSLHGYKVERDQFTGRTIE